MSIRFLASSGRIILSKPGYDASPSLPDAFKILDSDWQFSGAIIASGRVSLAPGNTVINFPAQHYVPAAEVYMVDDNSVFYVGGTITNSSINIDFTSGGVADYVVYGISQQ
jgi:hypothetical protein